MSCHPPCLVVSCRVILWLFLSCSPWILNDSKRVSTKSLSTKSLSTKSVSTKSLSTNSLFLCAKRLFAYAQHPAWNCQITYLWVTSHVFESYHVSMSHVTYQWVTSHINKSRHISMGRVTYQSVTSHISGSRHISMSHVTYHRVASHIPHTQSHLTLNIELNSETRTRNWRAPLRISAASQRHVTNYQVPSHLITQHIELNP